MSSITKEKNREIKLALLFKEKVKGIFVSLYVRVK